MELNVFPDAEACALRHILAHKPVSVIVAAALPGRMSVCEVAAGWLTAVPNDNNKKVFPRAAPDCLGSSPWPRRSIKRTW